MNEQQQQHSEREADAELARILRLERALHDAVVESMEATTPGGFHPVAGMAWDVIGVVAVGVVIAVGVVAAVTP